jgi:broad specificity phosphatase PhoE
MPTIYLIRHGETDWNRLGIYQGTTDVPLNAAGRAQARALGTMLRGVDFDAGYTSPLRRARATAEAVLGGTGVPLVEAPELREMCYGVWQGRGARPAGRCSPGIEWRFRHDPWSVRIPGGETLHEVRARAARIWERVVDAHWGDVVLLSGHGHFNRVLLIHVLGWEPGRFWQIPQTNGGCWRIEVPEDGDGSAPTAERLEIPVAALESGAAG